MPAMILDGKIVAKKIQDEVKDEVSSLQKKGVSIGLATILVGNDPASKIYVTSKHRICQSLGIYSERHDLASNVSEEEVISLIKKLNQESRISGILVQIPLPSHISEAKVTETINPMKDVDGFHPANLGKLMRGDPLFIPCTPLGIQRLLVYYGIQIQGADVVIVGRSNIVGKPLANLLSQRGKDANATVTLCHTATRDLPSHTRRADILIVAAGRAKMISQDMVKGGSVVIDVGINRIGKTEEGKDILCGDVDFEGVKEKAGAITPVPGGIGPMTTTMLMYNTVKAAKLQAGTLR